MAENVVLLSAGLDSVANFLLSLRHGGVAAAVTVDYGQRAAKREVERAERLCSLHGVEHIVVEAAWLGKISSDALTDPGRPLPAVKPEELGGEGDAWRAVWVPNRNGFLANVGACVAEARGVPWVVIGLNAEEGAVFPDNSPRFVEEAGRFFALSTLSGVRLRSFTQDLDKKEILSILIEWGVDLDLIWSCYNGGSLMCGRCESCARLLRAGALLGIGDKLKPYFRG